MKSKYQWPASSLSDKEMSLLYQEKQRTKKSICELLRTAVLIAYEKLINERETENGKKV